MVPSRHWPGVSGEEKVGSFESPAGTCPSGARSKSINRPVEPGAIESRALGSATLSAHISTVAVTVDPVVVKDLRFTPETAPPWERSMLSLVPSWTVALAAERPPGGSDGRPQGHKR